MWLQTERLLRCIYRQHISMFSESNDKHQILWCIHGINIPARSEPIKQRSWKCKFETLFSQLESRLLKNANTYIAMCGSEINPLRIYQTGAAVGYRKTSIWSWVTRIETTGLFPTKPNGNILSSGSDRYTRESYSTIIQWEWIMITINQPITAVKQYS